jgi:hypothetical protein
MAKETQIKLTKTRYRLGCLGVTNNIPQPNMLGSYESFFSVCGLPLSIFRQRHHAALD